MSIEVWSYYIPIKDLDSLRREYSSPYLDLVPDYKESIKKQVIELLLSEEEILDLETKLEILHLDN